MISFKELKTRLSILRHGIPERPRLAKGSAFEDISTALTHWFKVSYERARVHRDMHRMDQDCEVCRFALSAIASRAMGYPDPTVNSFTTIVEAREDGISQDDVQTAQRLIEDLIERLKLRPLAWQITRRAVKWGNEFREILYERDGNGRYTEIAGLKPLPEHTIWPNVNDRGDRLPGYAQRSVQMPVGSGEVTFDEYEIVHFLFGEEDDYRGTPLLTAARKNWKRLNLAEDSTAAARLIRAFMKLVHYIPVNADEPIEKQQQRIDEYKRNITERKVFSEDDISLEVEQYPSTVKTDYFLPSDGSSRGKVEMLDPENAQLQNIKDVEHFLRRLITATTVPFRYFPFEGSTPKLSEGGGQAEDVNFACTLLMAHQMLQEGYNKLFDIELLLHGIDPRRFRYVYRMARVNIVNEMRGAQADLAKARTAEVLAKLMPGILGHPGVILREHTSMSDVSIEKLMADKKVTNPPPIDEVDASGNGRGGTEPTRIQLPGTGVGEDVRSKE